MTEEERIRYARMIAIPEIGRAGMERLRNSHVFIMGCGALGSVCAMYLAGAGVGKISIADFDTIDVSNLQRQLFYSIDDIGMSKSETLAEKMHALNPDIEIEIHKILVTTTTARHLFRDCDFVVDGTDNPVSKLMTDRICRDIGKPYCIGGVSGWSGQVMSWKPGHAGYEDIFNPGEAGSGFTPCSLNGILGPAAGIIACCQASETIKHLTGEGEMLHNKIFTIDLLSMHSQVIEVR